MKMPLPITRPVRNAGVGTAARALAAIATIRRPGVTRAAATPRAPLRPSRSVCDSIRQAEPMRARNLSIAGRAIDRSRANWTVPPRTLARMRAASATIGSRSPPEAATPAPSTTRSPGTGTGTPASLTRISPARASRGVASPTITLAFDQGGDSDHSNRSNAGHDRFAVDTVRSRRRRQSCGDDVADRAPGSKSSRISHRGRRSLRAAVSRTRRKPACSNSVVTPTYPNCVSTRAPSGSIG
jgi:hypothetical protein